MDWSSEQYVRLFTRDTKTWIRLGWEGQAVLMMALRKAERTGVVDATDSDDLRVIFNNGLPSEVSAIGLDRLLQNCVIQRTETGLIFPNFIEAQETPKSDALRQRERRIKLRADAMSQNVTVESQNVTVESRNVMVPSRAVTQCHALSRDDHDVTKCHAVPVPMPYPVPVPKPNTSIAGTAASGQATRWSFADRPADAGGPAVATMLNERFGERLQTLSAASVEKLISALSDPLLTGTDVEGELAKAARWEAANRTKTARGLPKFLLGWVERSHNRGRAAQPQQQMPVKTRRYVGE